jgi:hypothetical protein
VFEQRWWVVECGASLYKRARPRRGSTSTCRMEEEPQVTQQEEEEAQQAVDATQQAVVDAT